MAGEGSLDPLEKAERHQISHQRAETGQFQSLKDQAEEESDARG